MIILQNSKFTTIAFMYNNHSWVRKFTIEAYKYDLKNAFGHFMIGVSHKDRTLKLLELGGPTDNQIITEMTFNQAGSADYNVDAFYEKPTFAIGYERNKNRVIWQTFHQEK